MRKFFLLLLLYLVQQVHAQEISVVSVKQLPKSSIGKSYHPKFSPNGEYLLLTSDNYSGLKKFDLKNEQVSIITEAPNAGYNVQISADGNNIIYREQSFNKRNMRETALKKIDLTNKKENQLISPTRDLQLHKTINGNLVYVKNNKLSTKRIYGEKIKTVPDIVNIENRQLVLYRNGERKEISPNGKNCSYLWPSISPDGTKLLYKVAGKGTFISNIDGSSPIRIANLNAPVWLGNEWIIGMNDKDNGERILSSSIEAVSIDGQKHQTLSDPSTIAMFPAVSTDNSSIAFNSDNGDIYLMKINIKQKAK
ncbi:MULTISPECIES: TolB-like translocation protein [Bacteroides]|jgi:hypothetical protein|uniref:Uncharacterized protein n=1 Tax=Bacteroides salyersiae CL02T12C01 TaxID=997887 RepID=I9TEM3_9BACE|nr:MULTISPECIES: PD40 domain-containing protein [Bacteroides]EIY67631.1 hypothetical protein HMPREF1071_01205 [Bacteroides salyersiae CL02T12C01]EOA50433.1 hypothetical protein HMPREF1532_01484 [Bacteroides salyersiae WAL 10018 = DSM 18765 = JCM 12988]MCS3058606.1 PD40 domain-containing protein [Bacteroides salyersiae]UYU39540.1 PD40 domain-containing protein [Bacteroides salyersiae]UYU44065.1 PD40 domain-containing protein [Bacteroides salyersiae]